jgi:YVTN family beta-propeller protein
MDKNIWGSARTVGCALQPRTPFWAIVALVVAAGCSSSTNQQPGATPSPDAGPSPDANPGTTPSTGKAYVGLFGDQMVAVLDTATKKVLKTIPVTAPDGIIITPDGGKVYVSSGDTGTVKVINTRSDTVTGTIDVGSKPAGIAITPDGHRVIVSVGGANEVVIIDTGNDTVVQHTAVAAAHSNVTSADGHYAYVGSQAPTAPAVVIIDVTGVAASTSYPVDKSPRMLSLASGKLYFSVVGLAALEVMDPATGVVGTPIPTGGSPHDTRPTRDGKFQLVVSQTVGDLELIDPVTAAVVANVPTGKNPHWIALTTDGARAYVTNEGDNNVSVVDLTTRKVTDTIAIGNAPRKIVVQP